MRFILFIYYKNHALGKQCLWEVSYSLFFSLDTTYRHYGLGMALGSTVIHMWLTLSIVMYNFQNRMHDAKFEKNRELSWK